MTESPPMPIGLSSRGLPEKFARTIRELYGADGAIWLNTLPSILEWCARTWSLRLGLPFFPLSYNYVAPAVRRDGTQVVLKVGFPHPELITEMDALLHYDGRGSVRLLACDREKGALMLERLSPRTPLADIPDDEEAISIAVAVMRMLWRPNPPGDRFPTVSRWADGLKRLRQRYGGGSGPIPGPLVEKAEGVFRELLASMDTPVLLHGDLHHHNILAASRVPWLSIDPKGVIGEAAYEIGAMLRIPMPTLLANPDPGRVLARRVDQFVEELGFPRERLLGWGMSQAVLSAWWSIEDHGHGWEPAIACAQLLSDLMA